MRGGGSRAPFFYIVFCVDCGALLGVFERFLGAESRLYTRGSEAGLVMGLGVGCLAELHSGVWGKSSVVLYHIMETIFF